MKLHKCNYNKSLYRVIETESGHLRHLCIIRFHPECRLLAGSSEEDTHTYLDIRSDQVERVLPGTWVPYDCTSESDYRRALDDLESILANYVLNECLDEDDLIIADRILSGV